MDRSARKKRPQNPRERANIFSLITFFYTLPIIRKGYNKDLEEDDIFEVLKSHKAKELGDILENQWKIENKLQKSPSLYRLIWKCFGKRYLCLGIMQFTVKTVMIIVTPWALGKLVYYFTPNQKEISKDKAYMFATLVVSLNLLNAIYQHNYILALFDIGIRIKTSFTSLIYRKSLKLSPAMFSEFSVGKIVTLTTKDMHAFDSALTFVNDMWISVIHSIILSYLIYLKVGLAAFTVIGFFLMVIPIVLVTGSRITKIRVQAGRKADERLQTTQETLSAIRIVKMFTWEKYFSAKIADIRRKEMYIILKTYYLKAINFCVGGLCSQICFYILIITYIWLGNIVNADVVYYLTTCFHNLKYAITISIPIGIAQTAELVASLNRVGALLKSQEISEINRKHSKTTSPKITLTDVSVKIKNNDVLKNINIVIQSGLNLLIGGVGNGKSTILKTILEEHSYEGKLNIVGRLSFASQEPWLFPGTIQQNILFGEPLNEERYHEVLRVCALCFDIDIFVNKDNTIVEDNGANLSKGQRARINLARAVYKESDIYLLDDCLTALDTQVQEYIFKECIQGFLKGKLVILITHNLNHLKDADFILNLKQDCLVYTKQSVNEDSLKDSKEKEVAEIKEVEEVEEVEEVKCNELEKINNELNKEKSICLTEIKLGKADDKVEKEKQNLYHEVKSTGKVQFGAYVKYIRFGGGLIVFFLLSLLFIIAQFSISYTDKLISQWVNTEENLTALRAKNETYKPEYYEAMEKKSNILFLYTVFIITSTVLTIARSFLHFLFCIKASINIHKTMIKKILNAIMEFFDLNYIGNILNRFSKDLGQIDESFPFIVYECLRIFCMLIGVYILIISVNITFIVPSSIFFIILIVARQYYIRTGRSLKRLDAATRSPMVGHMNASLEGLTTIRAFGTQELLKEEFDEHLDLYTSTYYTTIITSRGFSVCLDVVCSIFVTVVVMKFLVFEQASTEAGNVGLAITQAFMLTGVLQWGIRQWAELENYMTSVERALEYTAVTPEDRSGQKIENWPTNGKIEYTNVTLTYNKTKETVLKNVSFIIDPKQKIGIVGRTGAGKSSIIATMFRLYNSEGIISIDGTDINTLSLDFLRSSIAIIPQDPVLFSGTIRSNIDPFNVYTDSEIWKALEVVKLKHIISELSHDITESGENFSAGQKQLICLARAIVKKSKIVVLDEATANMDPETDALLHKTIKEKFAYSTVLTVAHRLNTVLHSDKVMVVDKGEIIEYDKPEVLLQNKDGHFYKMVQQANLL